MKKIYLVGAMCAYLFAGCAGNASQAGHDEHNHELEAHDHEHEGEDHDHDHEGHEHEGHDHEHEAGGTHPDEIVFKKALAEAVGLQTVTVNPAPFTDVIKTSGRVMAAQDGREDRDRRYRPRRDLVRELTIRGWYGGTQGTGRVEYRFQRPLGWRRGGKG